MRHQIAIERHVGGHIAVVLEIDLTLIEDLDGLAHLVGAFAARLAKPVKHSQLFATLGKVLGTARADAPAVDPARRLDPTLARRLPLRVLRSNAA